MNGGRVSGAGCDETGGCSGGIACSGAVGSGACCAFNGVARAMNAAQARTSRCISVSPLSKGTRDVLLIFRDTARRFRGTRSAAWARPERCTYRRKYSSCIDATNVAHATNVARRIRA